MIPIILELPTNAFNQTENQLSEVEVNKKELDREVISIPVNQCANARLDK